MGDGELGDQAPKGKVPSLPASQDPSLSPLKCPQDPDLQQMSAMGEPEATQVTGKGIWMSEGRTRRYPDRGHQYGSLWLLMAPDLACG